MKTETSLSIVIPCRNEKTHIVNCVQELLKQSHFLSFVEILIVDGMSDDGTREEISEKLKNDKRVVVVDNPKKVTPVAFNLGIKKAKGKYLMIIGARNILSPNYIRESIKDLENKPEVACTGGKVINLFTNSSSKAIAFAMGSSFGVGAGNFRTLKESQYTDTIGVPVYRRSIFNEIGLFDERLMRNQDDEFNYRVLKNKYKIWHNAHIENYYYVRDSFKNLFNQYSQYGYWKVFVNRLHGTVTTVRQLFPVLFLVYLISLLIVLFLNMPILTEIAIVPLLTYLGLAIFFAAKSSSNQFDLFPKVFFCFLLLHIGYGWGYLKGIIDFILLQKKPSKEMRELTR